MRIDSSFIRQILFTMEEEQDFMVNSHTIMQKLKIKGKTMERKFMGHILLLADEKLIESFATKHPFGFVYGLDGEYSIANVGYRLTSRGYEMIDVYKGKN